MISNKLKAQLIILTAFMIGSIVGASGQYLLYKRNVAPPPCDPIEELYTVVKADPDQKTKISTEVKQYRKNYEQVKAPIKPQLDNLRDDFRGRVKSILRPDQKTIYDQWNKDRDAKAAKDK